MSDINKLSYTNRDYLTIFNELKEIIPSVTKTWISRDESDPGIVLLKLIAMLGDSLSFNQDKMALEVYPNTVTQRKNAVQIYNLIGYKMHWYRSATCDITIQSSGSKFQIPMYTKFSTGNNDITYTYVGNDKGAVAEEIDENPKEITLVQGIPITPAKISISTGDDSFISQYSYNVTEDDITDNKIYFGNTQVDESHIRLYDDSGNEWIQVNNLDLLITNGRYFEFNIDENNSPYIKLVDYWQDYNISKFKLFYLISSGSEGEIAANTISRSDLAYEYYITNDTSSIGYNPEGADEAREAAANYINTYDTLVTLDDFRKAVRRLESVNNCIARDYTNDPNLTSTDKLTVNIYVDPLLEDTTGLVEEIQTSLRPLKMIPLDINILVGDKSVSTSPIKYCDWTVSGELFLSEPITRDRSTDLIVRINDHLKEIFDTSNIEFNTSIKYIDIVNAIMEVDKLIHYVDLDRTTYYNMGNKIEESQLTGLYYDNVIYNVESATTSVVVTTDENKNCEIVQNPNNTNQYEYKITLKNTPITPGSIAIRINNNIYLIKDDGYGNITCNDPILRNNGTVDYSTGIIQFELVIELEYGTDIYVEYKKNIVSIANYIDLNPNNFVIAADSIQR